MYDGGDLAAAAVDAAAPDSDDDDEEEEAVISSRGKSLSVTIIIGRRCASWNGGTGEMHAAADRSWEGMLLSIVFTLRSGEQTREGLKKRVKEDTGEEEKS